MPLVTIHTTTEDQTNSLKSHISDLKFVIAKALSGDSRNLGAHEISVRVITSDQADPIAQIEVLVTAFAYPERIQNQDKFCLQIKSHLEQKIPDYSFFVWLQLSEFGHSIDEQS